MESILDAINEWIKEILIGAINGNLSTMFGDVNEKVGTIAAEVGKTPQGWNANIFNMIQNLSENVIVPIAGLVITYVLCYELISMVTEKNNMHDVDTFMFFKWFFKAFVAVFLVTHTFDITMAVFDMAQHIVSGAAGVIGGDTNIDVTEALAAMQEMPFGRDMTLKRLVPQIPKDYDFVFFDCSPSLESLFNINVLVAVQYILIPIKVDKNSIEGYNVMLETVQNVRELVNPDIRVLGIFMTAVETGASLDREMIANFPQMLPELAFHSYIRKNIDVKKAPLALKPLCFYSPRCTATEDYAALCVEMLERMEG